MTRFFNGFWAFFLGFRWMWKTPNLRNLALIPFALDTVVFILGIYFGMSYLPPLISDSFTKLVGEGGFWIQILYYIVMVLSMISFVLIWLVLMFLIANVIASPFNGLLAERTLMSVGALQERPFEFGVWVKTSTKMFLISLIRAAIFVTISLFLFLLGLIPGVQIVAAFLALVIMALDCVDFSLEALNFNLSKRFSHYQRYFLEFSGLACALGLTFVIPGLNLLLYPAAVIGGSLLVASFKDENLLKKISGQLRSERGPR